VTLNYEDGKHTRNAMFQLRIPKGQTDIDKPHAFKLTIPLDETRLPLLSISMDPPDWLTISDEIAQFMAVVFPPNNGEFEKQFIRRVQRFGNPSVQFFVSRQISRSFTGLRAYRIASAVVMAYKAVELGNSALQAEALHEVVSHLKHADQCPVDVHPRRNREHLITSLLLVKWHLELALGQRAEFITTLNACREYAKSPLANFFTPAYNLSLSLLMLCIVSSLNGDMEMAKSVSDECFDLYRKAVRDADQRIVLFKELEVSHGAAHSCLQISSAKGSLDGEYEGWIRQALRVRGDTATGLLSIVCGLELPSSSPPDPV
jgi:hypothetical protein